MNKNKIYRCLAAILLITVLVSGCASDKPAPDDFVSPGGGDEALAFRPAECGIRAAAQMVYPYAGMTLKPKQEMLDKMNNYDIAVWSDERPTADGLLEYAVLSWYAQTEEQKKEEVTGFDPQRWRDGLSKIGAIGVYGRDSIARLDELTGCTKHTELGKSADGAYTYYLSIADNADSRLARLLSDTDVTITEMIPLDLQMGKTAFSEARVDAQSVGTFETTDIYGNKVTNKLFAESDLTLVNVFATWCSPCVQEMPELNQLKKDMKSKGVNVVAVVLDSVTEKGVDEDALALARKLCDKQKLGITMLVPDKDRMNGRLKGIDSVPESFFVDRNGNIVGETYVGAKTLEQWTKIVEKELEAVR